LVFVVFGLIGNSLQKERAVPKSQCDALETFFNSTGGRNWARKDGWLVVDNCCTWSGIDCNEDGVTEIQLSNNLLSGQLQADFIRRLPNLRSFVVGHNNLVGGLPVVVSASLENLHLDHNAFTGQIPQNYIVGLPKLRVLYIDDNTLQGNLPRGLLSQLDDLNVQNCHLNGNLPQDFGPTLRSFNADSNGFNGQIGDTFTNPQNLQELILSNNQLTGQIPKSLKGSINMRFLDLQFNQMNGDVPSFISTFSRMERFQIQSNDFVNWNATERPKGLRECDARDNVFKCQIPPWATRDCKASCKS